MKARETKEQQTSKKAIQKIFIFGGWGRADDISEC